MQILKEEAKSFLMVMLDVVTNQSLKLTCTHPETLLFDKKLSLLDNLEHVLFISRSQNIKKGLLRNFGIS